MREDRFTVVFDGDIRKFKGNPLKAETPFGTPSAAGIGDAFQETDDLRDRLTEAEAALSQARAEGRREGLEEAAKVADLHPMRFAGQNEQTIRRALSTAIRALAQKEGGKDG